MYWRTLGVKWKKSKMALACLLPDASAYSLHQHAHTKQHTTVGVLTASDFFFFLFFSHGLQRSPGTLWACAMLEYVTWVHEMTTSAVGSSCQWRSIHALEVFHWLWNLWHVYVHTQTHARARTHTHVRVLGRFMYWRFTVVCSFRSTPSGWLGSKHQQTNKIAPLGNLLTEKTHKKGVLYTEDALWTKRWWDELMAIWPWITVLSSPD